MASKKQRKAKQRARKHHARTTRGAAGVTVDSELRSHHQKNTDRPKSTAAPDPVSNDKPVRDQNDGNGSGRLDGDYVPVETVEAGELVELNLPQPAPVWEDPTDDNDDTLDWDDGFDYDDVDDRDDDEVDDRDDEADWRDEPWPDPELTARTRMITGMKLLGLIVLTIAAIVFGVLAGASWIASNVFYGT